MPSGASGALTGVLDSHNLLAKKLLELQQGLDALKKSQEDDPSRSSHMVIEKERRRRVVRKSLCKVVRSLSSLQQVA